MIINYLIILKNIKSSYFQKLMQKNNIKMKISKIKFSILHIAQQIISKRKILRLANLNQLNIE